MDIEFDLLSQFHSENWKKLSVAERKQVLEKLEHAYAKQQGREPCRIEWLEPEDYDKYYSRTIYDGYYSKGTIYLNRNLLKDENVYQSVFTALREGVCAWQDQVCKNPEQPLPNDWNIGMMINLAAKLNAGIDRIDYYLQPVEMYANGYAYDRMREIYEELKNRGLDDPGFWKYIEESKKAHQKNLEQARAKYGEKYSVHVQEKIRYKFRLMRDVAKQYNKKFENAAWLLSDDIEKYINETYLNEVYLKEEINLGGFNCYLMDVLQNRKMSEYLQELAKRKDPQFVDIGRRFLLINRRFLRIEKKPHVNTKDEQQIIYEKRRNVKRNYETEDALER